MADNFDLKKFLIENKQTFDSKRVDSVIKEQLDLSLPESEFWKKYQVDTEEYFNLIGDVPQEIQDDEDEGNGSRFIEYLEGRGIKAKHIGDLPTDNTSDYGAETYNIYSIGHGYYIAMDDYTNYYSIVKDVNKGEVSEEIQQSYTTKYEGDEDSFSATSIEDAYKQFLDDYFRVNPNLKEDWLESWQSMYNDNSYSYEEIVKDNVKDEYAVYKGYQEAGQEEFTRDGIEIFVWPESEGVFIKGDNEEAFQKEVDSKAAVNEEASGKQDFEPGKR